MGSLDEPRGFDGEAPVALRLDALRRRRNALTTELATAAHWVRLARARIDLDVAALLPPAGLSAPEHSSAVAPSACDLSAVSGADGVAVPLGSRLPDLHDVLRRLRDYVGCLEVELQAVTEELVERYARDPLLSLRAAALAEVPAQRTCPTGLLDASA